MADGHHADRRRVTARVRKSTQTAPLLHERIIRNFYQVKQYQCEAQSACFVRVATTSLRWPMGLCPMARFPIDCFSSFHRWASTFRCGCYSYACGHLGPQNGIETYHSHLLTLGV